LGRPVTAELQCQRQVMQIYYYYLNDQSQEHRIFFLTGRIHLAAGCADFFMGCPVPAEHLCQPAQQLFFVIGRICTSCVSPRSKEIFFLSSHFRAEVSGRQGAQKFFLLACPVASG
jgi:hypothetical protein